MTLQQIIEEKDRTKLENEAIRLACTLEAFKGDMNKEQVKATDLVFATAGAFAVVMYRLEHEKQ
jgi:hypothetical protein